jgi:hypothetical protein
VKASYVVCEVWMSGAGFSRFQANSRYMEALSQGEFGRLVRGGTLDERLVPVLRTMWSWSRSAVLKVHGESVAEARAYLTGRMAPYMGGASDATARSYLRAFETYVEWAAPADPVDSGTQTEIGFPPDGAIRGRADMVLFRGQDRYAGRLLLWDDLPMDRDAAEIIALPSLRAVERAYVVGSVEFVEIWQLRTRERERVNAESAAAREDAVRRILRRLDL